MLVAFGWTLLGLSLTLPLGALGHAVLRKRWDVEAPSVQNSESFASDLLYAFIGNIIFAAALALSIPFLARGEWLTSAWQFVALIFLHDAYFYWGHRLLHVPFLYRHVHSVHHRSRVPTPLSAMAMHPVEAVIEGLFVPLGAVLLHPTAPAFYGFYAFMIFTNTIGHVGIAGVPLLNGRPSILRWISQTDGHLQHHLTPDYNFGAYFGWWDRWFGTSHVPAGTE